MPNYLVNLTFDGSGFFGTQIQPGYPTIAGMINSALKKLYGYKIECKPCSRLDKGVSALDFYVNFKAESRYTCHRLVIGLNALLPSMIRVRKVEEVDEDFEARFCAISKTYLYRIALRDYEPLLDHYIFVPKRKPNPEILGKVLDLYVGKHDFTSFCSLDDTQFLKSPHQIVQAVTYSIENDVMTIRITARSFGRYQIRYMVGAAYECSINRRNIDDVISMLNGESHKHCTLKAPGNALILEKVNFGI